jgi:hypothetical protein
MKTTTITVLVFYTSLVAFFCMDHVKRVSSHAATDYPPPLVEQISVGFHYTVNSSVLSDSSKAPVKKKYRIFFENRSSKKLEVSIRYKNIEGKWLIDEAKTLRPGGEQEMGVTYSKTYFYHATSKKRLNRKAFANKYKSGENVEAMLRLGLTKQDIWECYSKEACNTFAVLQ